MIFLGLLLDGKHLVISLPIDKCQRALSLLTYAINKKKVTIKFIQTLTGMPNFLSRAIVPGQTFTRMMYHKLKGKQTSNTGKQLKQHHHVWLDQEFVQDCRVWFQFLNNLDQKVICHLFIDVNKFALARVLNFYSVASKNPDLGMGAVFRNRWFYRRWNKEFIVEQDPSIGFLELYALTAAVLLWSNA